MSKLDIDKQYDLAAKIQQLIIFVGLLSDEEVEALKDLRKSLIESNSSLNAVAGILTPLEESDHKISRQKSMIKRIEAFIAISETNKEMGDADEKLAKDKAGKETINRMFGL